jgi:electron transport complex protein RnfG
MKKFIETVSLLIIICVLSAASLTLVYNTTKDKIAEQKRIALLKSLKEVLPEAENFVEIEITTTTAAPVMLWKGLSQDKKIIGYTIYAKARGYSGDIGLIFGVDEKNKITGIKVLEQNETPGLGSKITNKRFLAQFVGLSISNKEEITLKKDNMREGKIDGITAATISSCAVIKAIHKGIENIIKIK